MPYFSSAPQTRFLYIVLRHKTSEIYCITLNNTYLLDGIVTLSDSAKHSSMIPHTRGIVQRQHRDTHTFSKRHAPSVCLMVTKGTKQVIMYRVDFLLAGDSTAGLPISYKLGPHWDDVITWSDFKSETSVGFLSPNYTGQCT